MLAFPAHPLEAALAVFDRLRAATRPPLTCSAGLAPWQPGENAQQVISRADTALYQAR